MTQRGRARSRGRGSRRSTVSPVRAQRPDPNPESKSSAVQEANELLNCPVTLEPFADPVVIPCGHTFSRSVLLNPNVTRCPLCRAQFNNNFDARTAPRILIITQMVKKEFPHISIEEPPLNPLHTPVPPPEPVPAMSAPVPSVVFRARVDDIESNSSSSVQSVPSWSVSIACCKIPCVCVKGTQTCFPCGYHDGATDSWASPLFVAWPDSSGNPTGQNCIFFPTCGYSWKHTDEHYLCSHLFGLAWMWVDDRRWEDRDLAVGCCCLSAHQHASMSGCFPIFVFCNVANPSGSGRRLSAGCNFMGVCCCGYKRQWVSNGTHHTVSVYGLPFYHSKNLTTGVGSFCGFLTYKI